MNGIRERWTRCHRSFMWLEEKDEALYIEVKRISPNERLICKEENWRRIS
jgi:hypothetical protein